MGKLPRKIDLRVIAVWINKYVCKINPVFFRAPCEMF